MLKALEYIESRTKVSSDLAMAAMYLPVMEDKMAGKEKTLETVTAVWDELETGSGQKTLYEINDYSMERTSMLNSWYVYFLQTDNLFNPEASETLKENAYYDKGVLLVEAYNGNPETTR